MDLWFEIVASLLGFLALVSLARIAGELTRANERQGGAQGGQRPADDLARLRATFEAGMSALSEAETDERGFYGAAAWQALVEERFREWLDAQAKPARADEAPYRTEAGRALTDADIEALADQAERGYDVERLRRRPRSP